MQTRPIADQHAQPVCTTQQHSRRLQVAVLLQLDSLHVVESATQQLVRATSRTIQRLHCYSCSSHAALTLNAVSHAEQPTSTCTPQSTHRTRQQQELTNVPRVLTLPLPWPSPPPGAAAAASSSCCYRCACRRHCIHGCHCCSHHCLHIQLLLAAHVEVAVAQHVCEVVVVEVVLPCCATPGSSRRSTTMHSNVHSWLKHNRFLGLLLG